MREILTKLANYWVKKGTNDKLEIIMTQDELATISKSEGKEINFGDIYMGLELKEDATAR